jgi:hypothetical protein
MTFGWVKLHKKIWEHPRSADPGWFNVWAYLLSNAAYGPFKTKFQGEVVELRAGQLVTGRKAISKATGIGESKVQRLLEIMEIEQQIEQQTESKSRLITIINWEKYQGGEDAEQQSEQQVNNKWTATEQQVNTLKRREEEKKGEREGAGRRRTRQPVTYEPSAEALLLFRAWKSFFPVDDAPRVQTCKNIQGRLKDSSFQALLFSVLSYRGAVTKAAAARPEGVLTYKGSNFFGEKAYYADHLPKPGQLELPQVQERLQAILKAIEAKPQSEEK